LRLLQRALGFRGEPSRAERKAAGDRWRPPEAVSDCGKNVAKTSPARVLVAGDRCGLT
jgi:hypothetical protein